MKWLCKVIGHKMIHYLDRTQKCARCGHIHVHGIFDGMKQHDPEWWEKYKHKPVNVAIAAYDRRYRARLR